MTSRRKRSSGPSSSAQQPDPVTFFLDQNIHIRKLAAALQQLGYGAELLQDHFDQAAEDVVWLPQVGKKGWVLLTRDRAIARRPMETQAIWDSGVRAFVVTPTKRMTADEITQLVTDFAKRMARRASGAAGPFVCRLSNTGLEWILPPASGAKRRRGPGS